MATHTHIFPDKQTNLCLRDTWCEISMRLILWEQELKRVVGTTWKGLGLTSSTTQKWSVQSNRKSPRTLGARWERNTKLKETWKSTNFIKCMKSWILLRWGGIVTMGTVNNQPEFKPPLSCFCSVKAAFQADIREPVLHTKQNQDWLPHRERELHR